MDKKRFEELKESIIEAGKIMRGEIEPSREFVYEVDSSEIAPPVNVWAVCVETDDEELLIPGKIYSVKIGKTRIWVVDEEGEATLCPEEFFLPISLPSEVSNRLEKLKQVA
jgi:hypothetical protein